MTIDFGILETVLETTKRNNMPFGDVIASSHRGYLKNHLEDAVETLTEDNKLKKQGIQSMETYRCGVRYYKKCLKQFGEVYNLDTFEEDYPEWCI